ncbi:MBL fold metallo-hydrolase [Actinosynnema sp. NPDC059797]
MDEQNTLRFIGNATTVLDLGPFTLLTDPNFIRRGQWTYLGNGLVSRRLKDPAVRIDELPPLDAVLLSHMHGDHFDRVAVRELNRDLPVLTTPQAARHLERRGFRETVALPTWADLTLTKGGASVTVTSLPGRHAPGVVQRFLPPVMGSMVEYRAAPDARPLRVYLSGDTLMHDGLRGIRERYPEIDVAVVHLGGTRALGVLLTMDGVQGADLLELLRPRYAVPVHYDDYTVMKSPLSDFLAEVDRRRPAATVVRVERGGTVDLPTRLSR